MKVTLNWLKQYVDFDWSPDELSERLTMLGLEVERVEKRGGEFDGIVVAQVVTRDKHPNADKLSLCRVNDGRGERQIVCGAQNFKPGDKVPLILPGASLPPKPGETTPFTIKVGKIRGVESHGMMCAPQELGLPDEVDGLLILSPEAKVGQPFAEYLGRTGSDVVYDLEVTPNRPDLNSVIGIAREIAAVTGNPLKLPAIDVAESGETCASVVAVRIADPALCPRYTARVITGVKVGPSPAWLRETLEKVGLRSISNVVDVTNYVMLECGQPLHAFDYHLIGKGADGKPTVVIRRATGGEKFTTLDGNEHELNNETLLIADEQKGIALAGVMGGLNTEINNQTVDVLLETACFNPTNIRRTAKTLGLRTDASYRFERGADIGICDWAGRRAAQLILQTAGGQLLSGLVDAWPAPPNVKSIPLRFSRTNALLGVDVPAAEQVAFLEKLELKRVGQASADSATFSIPTWRVDLKREADLIEEIARLYGVDRIPATPPRGALGSNAFDAIFDQHAEVRRILTSLGLDEAQGQTLIADTVAAQAASSERVVRLANPLSSDMNVLRPSVQPGLLEMLRHNAHRKEHNVALFEIGRVFVNRPGKLVEERRLAVAMMGERQPGFWSGSHEPFDISDLKGIVDVLTDRLGVRGLSFQRRPGPAGLFVESAEIKLGGKFWMGEMGQLSPVIGKRLDLKGAVYLAEFDLDQLLARRGAETGFKPLPAFPAISRDVAMIVPETVTHEQVLQTVKRAKPDFLEGVELFDVFRGKNIADGSKSLAYAFTYRHGDRTLKDDEANASHARVLAALRDGLGATIRDQ